MNTMTKYSLKVRIRNTMCMWGEIDREHAQRCVNSYTLALAHTHTVWTVRPKTASWLSKINMKRSPVCLWFPSTLESGL